MFEVAKCANAQKFQYVQVYHHDYNYVLCQIVEIVSDINQTIAKCNIIGYSKEGGISQIRTPFNIGFEVLSAEDEFIQKVIQIDQSKSAYIGKLEDRDIPVYLDLQKLYE